MEQQVLLKDRHLVEKTQECILVQRQYDELHRMVLQRQEEYTKEKYELNKRISEMEHVAQTSKINAMNEKTQYENDMKILNSNLSNEVTTKKRLEEQRDALEGHLRSVLSIQEKFNTQAQFDDVSLKSKKKIVKKDSTQIQSNQRFSTPIKNIPKPIDMNSYYGSRIPFIPSNPMHSTSFSLPATVSEVMRQPPASSASNYVSDEVHPHARIVSNEAMEEVNKVIVSLEKEIDELNLYFVLEF